ncbi:helix-turn-helix domain-containing protein [Ruminococcus sp. CLA-AA-H200]|uniref:Helix-turn-helix domain-containing protein n=1 Tax=Ruminococcus turbiniformis TaxID=2881258 RepID=A0ABS8FWH2_9FIRM|nr:helix-turn-helix domain-containing protein [Ruminococcus turbiniformis]MCC2253522.1 helix-turn-helix domain-containing protein [Ruminococcus turbiniformis]
MELGKQIRKYRNERSLSQDALAEQVFVSRQTISNWENDKSYPDVNSLVLLSETFEVSLDQLIKGDVEKMKEEIEKAGPVSEADRKRFDRLSLLFGVFFLLILITPFPLEHFLSRVGIAIWIGIVAAGGYMAYLVEKEKKKFDIQSYREIVAFTEGKTLSEIEKAREEGKRVYQKIFLAVGAGALGLLVSLFFLYVLGM